MKIKVTEADRQQMQKEARSLAYERYPVMPRWFRVAMADELVRKWIAEEEAKERNANEVDA